MLFNSYEFIFLFLPMVLLGYYLLFRRTGRLVFLTAMSYIFYGWWDYRFCALMLASTLIDYMAGKRIYASVTTRQRKGWLTASLTANLALLGFFKYYDLGVSTVNGLASLFSSHTGDLIPLLHIVLPVGISFYTFQSMSYSIDVYRGNVLPARNFWIFACYVSVFPQLVAGPIVRYHELADQLLERTHTLSKAAAGIRFFILGLAKKVILADGVAQIVRAVFEASEVGFLEGWAGVLAYAMQIYFDFSGYSDMAVGLGLLLGFKFPQNFDSPYKAVSITDFWRRWHMSLSGWLKDYLYIPLGGNRKGLTRTYVNLFITMLLGGLWHGANWTFVLWGGYHGLLLALERRAGKHGFLARQSVFLQRLYAFVLVLFGWVLFRCGSLQQVGHMFSGLLGLHGFSVGGAVHDLTLMPWIILGGCMLVAWGCPNTWEIGSFRKANDGDEARGLAFMDLFLAATLAGLFIVCVGVILTNNSSPFLYFQF